MNVHPMNARFQISVAIFFLCGLASCTYYVGPNQLTRQFKTNPITHPSVYTYSKPETMNAENARSDSLVIYYGAMPIPVKNDILDRDYVRIILAHLVLGRDIEQINANLIKLKPWADHGSTGPFHKSGDYDFSEISWCSLLYLFGDKPAILYPETREHLVNVLIGNSGAKPALRMPGTGKLFRETENHILMGEVSRYLKNQWLHEHGDTALAFNNEKSGFETWLLNHLDEKFKGGFYEFNSNPYAGYSFQALNTLFSFAHSDTVRKATNKLLNEIVYEYSLSSIELKRYPVYRRQPWRASNTSFDWDPISSIVRVLVNKKTGASWPVREKQHGLITLLLRYEINDQLTKLLIEKNIGYFACLGHGRKGSPEIYSGNKNYVLGAGGVQRGLLSQLAARPTILLLKDGVQHADSCFRLCGKGKMPHWNNTGVYGSFACASGPVMIPLQYQPIAEKKEWKAFYLPKLKLAVYVYSKKNLGLMLVSDKINSVDEVGLDELMKANLGVNLFKQFNLAGNGMVRYHLCSPKNRWVIYKMNDRKPDRKFDKWKRTSILESVARQE